MLHSCIVRACVGRAIVTAVTKAAAQTATERINMVTSPFSVLSLQRFGTPDDPMGFQPERRPVTRMAHIKRLDSTATVLHRLRPVRPKELNIIPCSENDRAHYVSRCRARPFVKVTIISEALIA